MRKNRKTRPTPRRGEAGQALVEYALIALLVIVALAAALYATGPAIGNVFSSAVLAALGEGQDRLPPGAVDADGDGVPDNANEATRFWQTVQALEGQDPFIPPDEASPMPTNTEDPENPWTPTYTPTDPPPTETMLPSATNEPTATPEDRTWVLPFEDDVQNARRMTNGIASPTTPTSVKMPGRRVTIRTARTASRLQSAIYAPRIPSTPTRSASSSPATTFPA